MPFVQCPWSIRSLLLPLAVAVTLSSPLATAAQDAKNPAAVRDFNAAAAALQNSGFYSRSAGNWAKFVQKYPADARLDRVHYYLGICQLHIKKYPEAVKTFETVLSKYSSFSGIAGAQYNLGMARFQIATASQNADDFKKAADALGVVSQKYSTSNYT